MTATISGDGTSTLINLTTSGNTVLGDASTDTLNVGNGGLVKDASGNVGIGTSSPAYKLNVEGERIGLTNGNSGAWITHQIQNQVGTAFYIGNESSSGGTFVSTPYSRFLWSSGAYPMVFGVNSAERMRIDSAGLLCIGTNSAYATNSKVSINVTNATGHGMTFRPDSAASYRAINFSNSAGSANVGFIDCTTSATTYSTSSDYRLKHDITPMSGALAKVGLLNPVTYKWNLDDSESQGFIAHELQAVVPECVTGEKDAVETYTDEDGNEQTRPVYQGIDTSFLVATLTAAIQEQQAIITQLQADVAALKGTP